jgi:hypothetical protein
MRWSFDDGSELRTGGTVSGDGPVAQRLRELLDAPTMSVAPPPSERVPLDVLDDFLLHLVALHASGSTRREMVTEYDGSELRASPEVARIRARAALARAAESPPDRVY